MRAAPPELLAFLAAFPPGITPLHLAVRAYVLTGTPDANELVYDACNAVSSACTFSERLKEGFCHVAAYAKHVNLGFDRGAQLDDPLGLLQGSSARIRHFRVCRAEDLQTDGLDPLLEAAIAQGLASVEAVPTQPRAMVQITHGARRRP